MRHSKRTHAALTRLPTTGLTAASLMLFAGACQMGDEDVEPFETQADVLIEGSPLAGTNGLAVAGDTVYVAGAGASRIQAVSLSDGSLIASWGAADGVTTPDDVAIGPDSAVYWTQTLTGEISRLTPEGDVEQVAFVAPGVNPIAFSEDGRLFTATCFFGESDAVYEVDPTGAEPPRVIAENIGAGCALNGAEFGPDGLLYGAQPFLGRVVRMDVDTAELEVLAEGLSQDLYAVNVAADGTVFAADGSRVVRITASGEAEEVAAFPFIADNLARTDEATLLVSSVGTASILEIDTDTGDTQPLVAGGLYYPQGLGLSDDSLLVVSGQGLERFSTDGTSQGVVSPIPFAAGSFEVGEQSWISAVPFAGTVNLWDPVLALPMPIATDLVWPTDAVVSGGLAYVADGGTGLISAYSLDGAGEPAVLAQLEGAPAGLAADGETLWVTDIEAGRVLGFELGAESGSEPMVVAEGLERPHAIAVLSDGAIAVVESGAGRLWRIDPASGDRNLAFDELAVANPPLLGFPTDGTGADIVVGDDDLLYVSDPLNNRVVRVELSH